MHISQILNGFSTCFISEQLWFKKICHLSHFNIFFFSSVNKYFAISAKTLTKALKPELQVKASRRFITEVKSQSIKNGEITKITELTTGKDITV